MCLVGDHIRQSVEKTLGSEPHNVSGRDRKAQGFAVFARLYRNDRSAVPPCRWCAIRRLKLIRASGSCPVRPRLGACMCHAGPNIRWTEGIHSTRARRCFSQRHAPQLRSRTHGRCGSSLGRWPCSRSARSCSPVGTSRCRCSGGGVVVAQVRPRSTPPKQPKPTDDKWRPCFHGSRDPTAELSDAGGPTRPNWQPMSPARIRSSDFDRRGHLSNKYHAPVSRRSPAPKPIMNHACLQVSLSGVNHASNLAPQRSAFGPSAT
jgi:hypothetical protein